MTLTIFCFNFSEDIKNYNFSCFEMRNAYNILVGKPEGKRLLGISRRRWEDDIRMDLKEIGTGWTG
jgi:hypothetical protein